MNEKVKTRLKIFAIPLIVAILIVIFEVYSINHLQYFRFHPFLSCAVIFIVEAFIAGLFVIWTKDFVPCAVLQLISCAGSMGYTVYRLILFHGSPADMMIFMIAANWAGITALCITVRFFQRKNQVRGFTRFFQCCSLILGIFFIPAFLYISFFKVIAYIPGYRIRKINFVPFVKTILPQLRNSVRSSFGLFNAVTNILSNILLFAPIGFYLTLFFRKMRLFHRVLIIFVISVCVETVQYLFAIGYADIDDVILNISGGLFGIFLCWIIEKAYRAFHHNSTVKLFTLKYYQ